MKAIIFDMDGVIIDSEPVHFDLELGLLKELGVTVDSKDHEAFVGCTDYHIWDYYRKKFSLNKSTKELVDLKKERFLKNIYKLELVENFNYLIDLAHNEGYKIALASSNNRLAIDEVLKTFDLGRFFDITMSGEEVSKGKPDPEIFINSAKKLLVNPSNCIVIEDAKNGVSAAKAAGMKCIGFKNLNSGNQNLSEADLIIDNYKNISADTLNTLL